MLKKLLCWSLIFSITTASAETTSGIGADTIILGKPGSNGPVKIKSRDGGFLKKNKNGDWLFSNDGILEKKMGSGSGSGGSSGINLLSNDSFEDGITLGWVSSGGAFSQQTFTNSSEGNLKYARLVATAAGQYVESNAIAIPDDFGAGCQADFKKYKTSNANAFKIEVMDATGASVYASQTLAVGTWLKAPTISFQCPSSGTLVKLRLTALAAGMIEVDRGYLGSNQNIVTASSTIRETYFASGTVDAAGGILVATAVENSTSKVINTPTIVSGNVRIIPKVNTVLDISASMRESNNQGSITITKNGLTFSYTRGTGTTTEISVGGGAVSLIAGPSDVIIIDFAGQSATSQVNFGVLAQSIDTNEAVSNEQSSWFIDANIGGPNPNLGTGNIFSYTEIIDANLDLVINTQKGSASAEIPCSTTNPSTGLTCAAGSESVGIAFIPPSAGSYEVCMAFAIQTQGMNVITQLVLTPNNSQTILEEGGDRQNVYGGANTHGTIRTCSNFTFTDTSKKTIRLMREQSAGASASLITDRDLSSGQRDVHVTVRPLLSAYNRPILTGDQVTSPGSSKPIVCSAFISASVGSENVCTTASCAISNNIGQCISSASRTALGRYSVILDATKINTASANCYIQLNLSSAGGGIRVFDSLSGAFTGTKAVQFDDNTASGSDASFRFFCHGIAP